jgi:ribosome-associated translation inhibitor RaiA
MMTMTRSVIGTHAPIERPAAWQRQASMWPSRRGKPDSSRRAPFPGWQPRPAKLDSRRDVPVIPAHIRAAEHDLGSDDRAYIRRKLGRALGKFAAEIVRVSVRTEDLNGPRGGVDRVCRIKVVLYGLPSVVFEKRDAALNAAVDGALAGVERAVRRALVRRRMKPRRRAASPPGAGVDA